jgi:hypothetical protein
MCPRLGVFVAVLVAQVLSRAVDMRAEANDDNPRVFYRAPLEDRAEIVIPVRVRERTLNLLVDTGSSNTMLSSVHADLLGKSLGSEEVVTFFGKETSERFRLAGIDLGQYTSGPLEVGTIRFEEGYASVPADGLIGSDAFKDSVLQLDFDAGEMRLLDRYTPGPDESTFEIRMVLRLPIVQFHAGMQVDGIVDTGNSGGFSLGSTASVRVGRDRRFFQEIQLGRSEVSPNPFALQIAKELKIGQYSVPDAVGVFGQFSTLGLLTLSQFRVTLDYPNKRLHLRPRSGFPDRRLPNASGLFVRRDASGTFVRDLYVDGVAYEAGMRAGDRIVSLDGEPIEKLSLGKVAKRLTRSGEKVVFVVERPVPPAEAAKPAAKSLEAAPAKPATPDAQPAPVPVERKTFEFTLRWPIPWPPVWPERLPVKKPIPVD